MNDPMQEEERATYAKFAQQQETISKAIDDAERTKADIAGGTVTQGAVQQRIAESLPPILRADLGDDTALQDQGTLYCCYYLLILTEIVQPSDSDAAKHMAGNPIAMYAERMKDPLSSGTGDGLPANLTKDIETLRAAIRKDSTREAKELAQLLYAMYAASAAQNNPTPSTTAGCS
ncbi:MAG: hypothetical protein LBD12_03580 [Clostridiales Family XIII bacterium]|jgi:hypothetical protein|nr:hypothetical protein [Clostridiales Family XIII bacterium]